MKVLLISPHASSDYDSFNYPRWRIHRIPPLGLLSIAGYLDKNNFDVEIIDCRELIYSHKTNDYLPILLQKIQDFSPDFIGITIYTANFSICKEICNTIKRKNPLITIVIGGPHPSIEPDLTFSQITGADIICVGPGEEAFLHLLRGEEISKIPNLLSRNSAKKEISPYEINLDSYPFPDYHLFNLERQGWYTEFTTNTILGWGYKALYAITTRGCPFSCKFCASDWSKPLQMNSAEYVVELARRLCQNDIQVVGFLDSSFAINRKRLESICNGFIKNKIFYPHTRKRWWAGLRSDQIDQNILELMKAAGCFSISIGMESGSNRILGVLNKKIMVEQHEQAARMVREAGLALGASFMVGVPTETAEEMTQTQNFMKNLQANTLGYGIFRPLPGSPFYNTMIHQNLLNKETQDWDSLGNFSIMPEQILCNTTRDTLNDIFWKGAAIAYGENLKNLMLFPETAEVDSAIMDAIKKEFHICISERDDYTVKSLHKKTLNEIIYYHNHKDEIVKNFSDNKIILHTFPIIDSILNYID